MSSWYEYYWGGAGASTTKADDPTEESDLEKIVEEKKDE